MSDYDFDSMNDWGASETDTDLSDEEKVEALNNVLDTAKFKASVGSKVSRIDFGFFTEDCVNLEMELRALK